MRQESIHKLVVGARLAIGIAGGIAIVLAVYVIDVGYFEDLLLNLIAEIVGTILFAYVLAHQIQQREKKRWMPAKCLLYSRLLEMIDDFLIAVLPEESRELRSKIYKSAYGDIYAIPAIEPLREGILSLLPPLIERDIEARGSFDDMPLVHAERQLEAILDRSAFLLDAEPISLLLRLERSLGRSIELVADVDWGDEHSRKVFAHLLGEVISVACEVKTWLERILDQHFAIVSYEEIDGTSGRNIRGQT